MAAARTGMLVKAPWEQYMVHMRAYPFKGLKFHDHNPQSWLLYVLNTFAHGVNAFDPLNPSHHKHIGVGLSILFFEVMYRCMTVIVMKCITRIEM